METIKDYLLTVLIKIIIGYVLFMFFLLVIFVGYIVVSDWESAVKFMTGFLDNDYTKIVACFPLVFAWFNDEDNNKKYEDNNKTIDFVGMPLSYREDIYGF